MNKMTAALAALVLSVSVSGKVHAAQFVQNGGFEVLTKGPGQLGFNTNAKGWVITNIGNGTYTFVFAPGTDDTTGTSGQYGGLALWGPNNGSANGLPATSPDGGNFLAVDADFQQAPVQQTIHNLIPGDSYALTFDWAAAQQQGFDGPTTDQFQVSLGGDTQSTDFVNLDNHGFSPWQPQTFNYTATSSTEVLSFFANGAPQVPPFALLDGVSLTGPTPVPEPSSVALMLIGAFALIVLVRRRAVVRNSAS